MINDYNKLSEKEYNEAIDLYQQSIRSKMIADILTPLQGQLCEFCKENDLMVNNSQSAIILDIFQQNKERYSIALCAYPSSEASKKLKQFESSQELINWQFFDLTQDGIDLMLKTHQQLIRSIAFFTNFDREKMYNLAEELENFNRNKVSGRFGSF